jgi:hypothetical protein
MEKSSTGQKEVFPLLLGTMVIFSADPKSFLSHLLNVHFPITRFSLAFLKKSSVFMLGYRLAEKTGVEPL